MLLPHEDMFLSLHLALIDDEKKKARIDCNVNEGSSEGDEKKYVYKVPSLESLLLHEGGFEDYGYDDNEDNTSSSKSSETSKNLDIKLLEGGILSSDFISGINELNGNIVLQDLPLMERRKILFGSDLLL